MLPFHVKRLRLATALLYDGEAATRTGRLGWPRAVCYNSGRPTRLCFCLQTGGSHALRGVEMSHRAMRTPAGVGRDWRGDRIVS